MTHLLRANSLTYSPLDLIPTFYHSFIPLSGDSVESSKRKKNPKRNDLISDL